MQRTGNVLIALILVLCVKAYSFSFMYAYERVCVCVSGGRECANSGEGDGRHDDVLFVPQ